jgi:acyl-CoA thioesterase
MLSAIIVRPNPVGVCLTVSMQPEYASFAGAFGGWTAAQAMLASEQLAREGEEPIALTIDFLKAVSEGDAEAHASVVNSSKSTQFMRVETKQSDTLRASSSVIWSRRRETDHLAAIACPATQAPEGLAPLVLPSPENTWLQRFDMRHSFGRPLKRSEQMRSLVWTRFRDDLPLNVHRLVALADASVPRIFYHYSASAPISTLTMSVYFHATSQEIAQINSDFVLIEASSSGGSNGYFDQQVRIWSREGKLLATSSQLVWFNVVTAAA